MEYYLAKREDETFQFTATLMELEEVLLSKVSQKERQIPNDLTHMWSIKKQNNLEMLQWQQP